MAYTYIRAGQRLTADALNDVAMVGQSVFYATRDTAQSIPTSVGAAPAVANALSWETAHLDDLGGWSSGSPTRYTATVAGWYELAGACSIGSGTAGDTRSIAWFLNGAVASGGHGDRVGEYTGGGTMTWSARTLPILLAVGDYIELVPGQDNGSALNTGTGQFRPYAEISFVRPAD